GVTKEPTTHQPSDSLLMWRHGSDGESDRRQVCDGPSRVASCSGSTTPRRQRT
ncbi:hypothetical protein HAX54_033863, partial [Datura stramonium]|nr:hypothetical protein [Datura stramonium]